MMSKSMSQSETESIGWRIFPFLISLLVQTGCTSNGNAQDALQNEDAKASPTVPKDWHQVKTKAKTVQAAFPGQAITTNQVENGLPVETFSYSENGVTYFLHVTEADCDEQDTAEVERKLPTKFLETEGLKLQAREFKWNDFPAFELQVEPVKESENETKSGFIRGLSTGNQIIGMMLMGPSTKHLRQDADAFFATLAIRDSKSGDRKPIRMLPSDQLQSESRSAGTNKKVAPKLSKPLIQELLQAESDVDFFLRLNQIDWEEVDIDLAAFVVDLCLTAEDMSSQIMIINATADASISVLGLHDALQDRSIENWYRRRTVRALFAKLYGQQDDALRAVVTLEARSKALLAKIGGFAAPAFASLGRFGEISELGDSAIDPLQKCAGDQKSPYRLACYFALRELYPEKLGKPLELTELTKISKQKKHTFRKNAIEELVHRGYASKVIEEFLKKRTRRSRKSDVDTYVQDRRSEIEKIQNTIDNWDLEEWRKASNYKNLGEIHHSLYDLFKQSDQSLADAEFNAAIDAFQTAKRLLQVEVLNERDADFIRAMKCFLYRDWGRLYQSQGDHTKAINRFRLALSVDSDYLEATSGIAESLVKLEQYQAAADQFAIAEKIHDANYRARDHRYALAGSRESFIRESIEIQMQRIEALKKLGKSEEVKKLEGRVIDNLLRL